MKLFVTSMFITISLNCSAYAACSADAVAELLLRFTPEKVDVLCGKKAPSYTGTKFEDAPANGPICNTDIGICSLAAPIPFGAPCECRGGGAGVGGFATSNLVCGRPAQYVIDSVIDQTESPKIFLNYLGIWSGSWNNSRRLCGGLVVENVRQDGTADVIYVYGPSTPTIPFPWKEQRRTGTIDKDGTLSFKDDKGNSFTFTRTPDSKLDARFTDGSANLKAVFSKLDK
jgi:hypothetical protein